MFCGREKIATVATEYEGFAVGYDSATTAWDCVAATYVSNSKKYPGKIFDNVGWVKGTKETYGSWGGYLWLLQNTVAFQSSPTNVWVSQGGVTNYIAKVLVGSIGDYSPMTDVVDVGPTNWNGQAITDYLGAGQAEDYVCRGDFTAYYKLAVVEFVSLRMDGEGPVTFDEQTNEVGEAVSVLQCGSISAGDPGIEFTGHAKIPEVCDGTLQFVQIIKSTRTITFQDNSKLKFTTGDTWHLDTKDPCAEGKLPVIGTEKYFLWSHDTPMLGAMGLDFWIDRMDVNESFEVYFLFKPTDGERHTLGKASWEWRARVINFPGPPGGILQLDEEFSAVPDAPDGVEFSNLPVTSPVWPTDLQWQVLNGDEFSQAAIWKSKWQL